MAGKKKMFVDQTPNKNCADPSDRANAHVWLVTKVSNSTTPRIGDVLTRAEVDGYCEREDWEVTIQ